MNRIKIPTLKTERLVIRPLTRKDVDFLFNHYKQEAISRFTLVEFSSLEEANDFYERWCDPGSPTRVRVGLELKQEKVLVGTVCFENYSKTDKRIEIGYSLGEKYWGRGLMTEALQCIIQFMFEELGFNRIEATTHIENKRSQNLLLRLGFEREGILRQKYFFRGKFQDEVAFSLLKEEWKENNK